MRLLTDGFSLPITQQQALFEAIMRAPVPGQLYIHTDSQYAIDCISKWRVSISPFSRRPTDAGAR